jgi:DNA modification methylase
MIEIEYVSTSKLKPYDGNPRKMEPSEMLKLRRSLKDFGFVDPIIVRKSDNLVIGGHQRLDAAKEEGIMEVPVVYVEVSDDKAGLMNIALNKISGDWDYSKLGDLFQEIDTGIEDLEQSGFDAQEIEDLLNGLDTASGDITEDEIPETPEEAISKLGDLWIMGEHKLLCGDSTSKEDVERLMGGEKAELCFTSPPYGQQRDYTEQSQIEDWDELMKSVFSQLPMAESGQVLVNLGLIHRKNRWVPYWEEWMTWMTSFGRWRNFGWYVWDQGAGMMGDWQGRLAPSFEFIFHFNRESVKPRKTKETKESSRRKKKSSDRGQRGKDGVVKRISSPDKCGGDTKIPDSVIRISRNATIDMARNNHPATFPVQLPAEIIDCWGGLIYEPFSGSGTTIIAAEQLNRKCYAMEIAPIYVDVAVKRWENLTGKTAVLEKQEANYDR